MQIFLLQTYEKMSVYYTTNYVVRRTWLKYFVYNNVKLCFTSDIITDSDTDHQQLVCQSLCLAGFHFILCSFEGMSNGKIVLAQNLQFEDVLKHEKTHYLSVLFL